ncbi:hypothetical protein BO71DRAFT_398482 [Aspergillus ellipticus CBS 707.79]|uniref:Uncharacterized protein n=1 Tax=Aspergillus ellipticus CBS 707.79 TaxID=1448320 RepID=A0A319DBX2_9EURO|nr:hypothetical protein BO71DRAFT_398482 [Aspergillus ellipticus CBS 707.79]
MFSTTTLTTLFLATASLVSATPLAARSDYVHITTWSGNNCEGSSANPTLSGSGNSCFQNLPGASFNAASGNSNCKVTTWSGTNCEGSSAVFQGTVEGCIGIPFASVSIDC